MASFTQHVRRIEGRKLPRVTWLCGSNPWLRQHTLDWIFEQSGFSSMAHESYHAQDRASFWDSAFSYTIDQQSKRFLVLNQAERCAEWSRLFVWAEAMRELPLVHLVFHSTDPKLDTSLEHVKLCKDKGDIIECGGVNAGGLFDWLQARTSLSAGVCNKIIQTSGGDPKVCWQAAQKLGVFNEVTTDHVLAIMDDDPTVGFVDALTYINKSSALKTAPRVRGSDMRAAIGMLVSRLDYMAELHRAERTRTEPDVPQFIKNKFSRFASGYTKDLVRQRREVLAVVDEAANRGESMGAAEVLVRLW